MKPTNLTFLLLAACAAVDESSVTEDIHGTGATIASQFQRDRQIAIHRCNATRIAPNFAITALHCKSTSDTGTGNFYSTGSAMDSALTTNIAETIRKPGMSSIACRDNGECDDASGTFADIALIRLTDVVPAIDGANGAIATLAWRYPGDNVWGVAVGAGDHDGNANDTRVLKQIADTTDGDDSDGAFWTANDVVNPADSGGPFYVGSKVVGIAHGYGWDAGSWDYTQYTSVARHLDWILTNIGYRWAGQPAQANTVYNGSVIESFLATERVCQYACEHTASCQAYNFVGTSCGLYTNVTGSHAQSGWKGALHYGASSGKTNEVVGYLRSDGYNSVVHKATDGSLHEIYRNGLTWQSGTIFTVTPNRPAISGKLSAYRRGDGVNAIVYRSGSRIIEVALGASGWDWADLGGSAVGDPVAFVRADGVSAVVFRSSNNHINELRLGTNGWIATDLTADASSSEVASSDPAAFVRSDGRSSIVFRSSANGILELFKTPGQRWAIGGPSSLAGAPAAASRPYGYTHHDGTNAIVYRSTTNRIIELWLDGAGWHFGDITGTGQPAAGNPVATTRIDAIEEVVYRSSTNQLFELTNDPWRAWNLSAIYGVSVMTDPSLYVRNDKTHAIVYGLASNHAGELSYDVAYGWAHNDLTLDSGETP